ncbi:MAG: ATP-binding cassette domain-containing protein [Alphaproteobacteria bacterium]|nr:ATP-binding cassette domain-containing protein [Alphaproteobacteria bacterium SS10]
MSTTTAAVRSDGDQDGAATGTNPSTNPALEIHDLHKRFGDLHVLNGVSMNAADGDVISIIGSSGSGKSTMLRCVNLLETPDQGVIKIAGEQIRMRARRDGTAEPADRRQVDRIRASLGMVFQGFNLWSHMTALENVTEAPIQVLGRSKREVTEEARELLEKVGVGPKADAYPSELSGGQQQRVAIARALAMRPKVMLFDEPTSALDPELVGEVLRVMRALAEEGMTMLIVTHEMGFAREVSSEVVFLHEGQVEERGSPQKVFERADSERCRQFLASQL